MNCRPLRQLPFPSNIGVAYGGFLATVRSGGITEDDLDASVPRILRVKEKAGPLSGSTYASSPDDRHSFRPAPRRTPMSSRKSVRRFAPVCMISLRWPLAWT